MSINLKYTFFFKIIMEEKENNFNVVCDDNINYAWKSNKLLRNTQISIL